MPLHFPARRLSDIGSQIRERKELREARRLKKPLNQNETSKVSKLQKISDWALEIKTAIPTSDRKNKSPTRNSPGFPRTSVSAGKQPLFGYDRSLGARYSPTYASMMSAVSGSSGQQRDSDSNKSCSSAYQKDNFHNDHRPQTDDDDNLIIRPSWDPPEVGPSTWWKYPPPGYREVRMAEENLKARQRNSNTSIY